MSKIIEDMIREAEKEAALYSAREIARIIIEKGEMPLEEIAYYIPRLSLEEIKQLEAEIKPKK